MRNEDFIYLVRGKQRTTGGSGRLPPPLTAITVINGDQNTQVTQWRLADHLSDDESSAASTVNTGPSDARVGRSIAYSSASGCVEAIVCVCVCADSCLCVCICVYVWEAFKALMASFHCGHPVSSDNVTMVCGSFLQLCLQTQCVTQSCR